MAVLPHSVSARRIRPTLPGAEMPISGFEMTVIVFLIVIVLYFGQVVLVPLALAVILSFVLAPAVRALRRLGLSNTPSVLVSVAIAFSIIFGIGALITQQVGNLVEQIPTYQTTLSEKVKALKDLAAGSGGAIKQASETLKNLQKELEATDKPDATPPAPPIMISPLRGPPLDGTPTARDRRPLPVEVHAPAPSPLDQLQSIIAIVVAPVATAAMVVLFVLFLLLQREDVRDRAIRLLGAHDLERSTTAMDDAGERLGRYFLTLTAINAAFGGVIALGLAAIGVPSPLLWGVLAMLMRFVPFIGSFIAAACPLLLAAAVDPGWSMFLMTLALYVVTEPIMGSIVEPVVQGQRTGLSPLAVIISAAFWTLLWGPIGLLLAIPLTVVLVVLGHHVERLAFLNVLLGDTPPLEPPERFYQRMLAGDPAEAVEQADRILQEKSLVDYYDDVMVEGLILAQADADRGTLNPERLIDIRDAADIVIDTLSDHNFGVKRPTRPEPAREVESEERPAKTPAELEQEEEEAAIDRPVELQVSEEWKRENAVLCVASRTPLDEVVGLALAQLLQKYGIGAKVVDALRQHHGVLRSEDLEGAKLICISALDVRERSAHARFLVRRLRRSAPRAVILGGFWKLDPETKTDAAIVESVIVDGVATTLREALRFCLDTARDDSAAAQAAAVAPMRSETCCSRIVPSQISREPTIRSRPKPGTS